MRKTGRRITFPIRNSVTTKLTTTTKVTTKLTITTKMTIITRVTIRKVKRKQRKETESYVLIVEATAMCLNIVENRETVMSQKTRMSRRGKSRNKRLRS